jgi:superfamily I DNA/RNA helicase
LQHCPGTHGQFQRYTQFDERTDVQEELFTIQKFGEVSTYHIYSIVLACETASAIKLQNPSKSISIITPYGTQARLIKEIAYAFKNQNVLNTFEVSTVHRYQGDENDVVILVMNPPKSNPYEFSHFNNSYLINVGISRAKECLFILYPENVTGYSEITAVVRPLAENFSDVYSIELET